MEFDLTDEQRELAEAARAFFAGECTPAHVRAAWDDDTGRSPARWRQMGELGLLGVTVPEAYGGLGLDEVALVGAVEAAGYAALPEPLVDTAAVGAALLIEAGTPDQAAQWLPRIVEGEAVVAVQLSGQPLVADAHVADLLVTQRDDELHAVPAEAVRARPQPLIDPARRVCTVEAETSDATRMAGGRAEADAAFDRGATFTAAFCNGLAQRMLDMSVRYAGERHQFGRPIGSFQAIKHKLAETWVAVETSRPASWYAAYTLAGAAADRPVAASVAKSYAADAAEKAHYEALQVHGGIGFTWEHDLHVFLKRAIALAGVYGTAREHRARLADHVLAAP